ncbi:MAG: type II secretion system F family protein [Lachnospiraceae bacterium]|nr:type II secretion system F family protein [Lachnospiraceae bacterium]
MKPEKIICFAVGACLLVGALAYAFYRSWWAVPFMLPAGGIWFIHSLREEKRRTLENGRGCFRDGMRSISAALSAGYSPENAVREAAEELRHLYGEREVVVREFQLMVQKLNMNRPIETVLTEAADELGLEDLQSFAEVFAVARRSGGQLVSIIGDTVAVMEEKEQTQEELATMLSGKLFEQQILTMFPLGLIAYLNMSADGFFHILYTTMMGRIVMTICLFIYLAAVGLAWKIGQIRV